MTHVIRTAFSHLERIRSISLWNYIGFMVPAIVGGIVKAFANVAYKQGQLELAIGLWALLLLIVTGIVCATFGKGSSMSGVTRWYFIALGATVGGWTGSTIMSLYGSIDMGQAAQSETTINLIWIMVQYLLIVLLGYLFVQRRTEAPRP